MSYYVNYAFSLKFDGEVRFRAWLRSGRTMLALPRLIQTRTVEITILGSEKMLVIWRNYESL